MRTVKYTFAANWGRAVANYSTWTVAHARFVTDGVEHVPQGPVIWAGWHATNLVALAVLPTLFPGRTWHAFVAPGLTGVIMQHWLERIGPFRPMVLEEENNMKAAIKQMTKVLLNGDDLVIAVDGPHGPAGSVRPGALWLARRSGCPIVPGAFAVRPGLRLPRWDRLIVPIPGGSISAAFGAPLYVGNRASLEDVVLQTLRTALQATGEHASAILDTPGAHSLGPV